MQRKIALVASNAPAAMEAEAELRPLYDFVDLGEADMLIALGGDGFLLHMLHQLLDQRRSLPVFGMNRGTIGFLMNEFRVEGLLDVQVPGLLETQQVLRTVESGAAVVGGEHPRGAVADVEHGDQRHLQHHGADPEARSGADRSEAHGFTMA